METPQSSMPQATNNSVNFAGHILSCQQVSYNQLMPWAACSLSFFAFMHSGELMVPTEMPFDPPKHLTPRDAVVDCTHQVPHSRKVLDQTGVGVDLFVGCTSNSLCPVVADLRSLTVRGFQTGPLFC